MPIREGVTGPAPKDYRSEIDYELNSLRTCRAPLLWERFYPDPSDPAIPAKDKDELNYSGTFLLF